MTLLRFALKLDETKSWFFDLPLARCAGVLAQRAVLRAGVALATVVGAARRAGRRGAQGCVLVKLLLLDVARNAAGWARRAREQYIRLLLHLLQQQEGGG
ncbi:hypothetical protein A2U01_0047469 [Trifolium medium]|uniref:Uncharacterized protein n=1 Tax=Trifolium medium TaxID=97028 RepID=A0A392QR19_9FABA|nr:hypothetical protein [Trifolium medium]